MKKSLSIVLCIIMIAMTFCSCSFIKSKENKDENTTTSKAALAFGSDDLSETEESTESSESSDSSDSGEKATVTVFVTDANGEYVTDKNGEKVSEVLDTKEIENQFKSEIENQASTSSKSGSNSSSLVGDTTSSEDDLLPEGKKTNDTTLMKTKVEPILKNGTYTIKGSIQASGKSINATIAFRNSAKDFSVTMSMSGISLKAYSNNGKYYIALPMAARYCEVSQSDMGDMSSMAESFKSTNSTYVGTSTVKDGKTTYTCEEYKTSTGTAKYYFNSNNEWKRLEIIGNDDVLVWEISSFTNKADDSLFAAKGMIKDDNLLSGSF